MMEPIASCPACGGSRWRNPTPTVDIVIHIPGQGVVLIERANEPYGWALPGGFIDYGESAEAAAVREAKEETCLTVELTGLLGVYSDPGRDPRQHTLSVVYTAMAVDPQNLEAADDAKNVRVFQVGNWPSSLAFDHALILGDYQRRLERLGPV